MNCLAGIFETAHKGTIFLDEIGEMAVSLQSRLLRVIQEREVIRLGGGSVIPVDVRIISATNKNLFEEMKKGNFRKDLYYRLSILTLQLPLLEKHGREITGIADSALELLMQQHYYGNIRELSNIIERAAIFATDTEITAEDVKMALSGNSFSENAFTREEHLSECPETDDASSPIWQPQSGSSKEGKEKERILTALHASNGNYTKAAVLLKISRTTLWRRMKKYGIEGGEI